MTKERRLGRGLEALLGKPIEAMSGAEDPAREEAAGQGLPRRVRVDELERNPFQPRQDFDEGEIESLADSIRQHGLLQPILVRDVQGRFQLVAGERRLRAAVKAGWTHVPVQVVAADDRQAAELAIVENLQRKDLNPLEKASCFQQYLQRYACTQDELARRLQIDRSTVANMIRLLELPDQVQDAVRRGAISQGHARALLPLGDENEQLQFCSRIASQGLSVRETEALVQDVIRNSDREPLGVITNEGERRATRLPHSDNLSSLEQEFRLALGAKVVLRQTAKGRGRLVVHFDSHKEFERLRAYLCEPRARQSDSRAG